MAEPTLRQLRYFLALVEHEHFGRAAKAVHVSPSAFSAAIAGLEEALGVQLVDRTRRRVTVTATGDAVAVQARLVLRDVEDLMDLVRGRAEPLAGPLHLGVIPTVAPFMLPRVLPGLREAHPKLELYLREDTTERLHGALLEGALDVLLIALPFPLAHVEVEPLFRDRFRLACRPDTRHVDPAHYRPSRLDAGSVLLLEEGHCLREHAIDACRLREARTVSRFAATSLLTLVEMVEADLGITFLPEMAEGSALLEGSAIRTWPLRDDHARRIGLVWRRGSGRSEEFRLLGRTLVGIFEAARAAERTA